MDGSAICAVRLYRIHHRSNKRVATGACAIKPRDVVIVQGFQGDFAKHSSPAFHICGGQMPTHIPRKAGKTAEEYSGLGF
jgi:hypothetical protein